MNKETFINAVLGKCKEQLEELNCERLQTISNDGNFKIFLEEIKEVELKGDN